MEIAKSADCEEYWHGECGASWCACWCHDEHDYDRDSWRERETSEDDHIMWG